MVAVTTHDPATHADFDQRLAEANAALDTLIAQFREVGKSTDGPTNLSLLQESFIADSDMTTVSALAAAAVCRLAGLEDAR